MQWHDVTRKILGGHWGGQAKFWGGSGPPGTPLAPTLYVIELPSYFAREKGWINESQANSKNLMTWYIR